jgi:ADP-ribose pyrophosphatase YjhB (NUDIX family)
MNKNPYKNIIETTIRAVIEYKGKILLCHLKGEDYYFFPGGHLEFGEKIKESLAREIKEELNIKMKKASFIGVVDNLFKSGPDMHHEINLFFKAEVDKISTSSQEGHIDFALIDKNKLAKTKIYPVAVKKQLTKWFKDKKTFWVSQPYE